MSVNRWLTILAFGSTLCGAAKAASFLPFMPEEFMADQASGRPTVIEVYAPSCSVCIQQQPIIDELENDPRYADVTVLRVDSDTQKSVLGKLHVTMPSTLIGFHGTREIGRLVGDAHEQGIESLFASTLAR